MNRKRTAIEEEIANQQTKILNSFTKKIKDVTRLRKDMNDHEQSLSKVIADMQDPEADRERIFQELSRMGFSFEEGSIRKSDELFQQAEEVSKFNDVIDLRELQGKITEFGKDSIQFQEELLIFEQKLGVDSNVKSLEILEQAQKMALEDGRNKEAVQAIIDRLKAKIQKKL